MSEDRIGHRKLLPAIARTCEELRQLQGERRRPVEGGRRRSTELIGRDARRFWAASDRTVLCPNDRRRMTRRLLVVLATAAGMLIVAPAARRSRRCRYGSVARSAVYTSVAGNNRVEPIVANGNINTADGKDPDHAQCATARPARATPATQLGIPQNFLGARTGKASTTINPELGKAIDQTIRRRRARRGPHGPLPRAAPSRSASGGELDRVGEVRQRATTKPQITGDSQVAEHHARRHRRSSSISSSTSDRPRHSIRSRGHLRSSSTSRSTADSLTVSALHVKVLQRGSPPLVDLVVAESKVAADGPVCDPTGRTTAPATARRSARPARSSTPSAALCIIPAGTRGSGLGEIIVGRPFQGPSGGTVVPLDVARRRYGSSPCLSGAGAPKFAIIGTNRGDRITGTNIADRIIGLGGNDKLDGGRGNDCIEGRTGGDNISGGLGNDKLYGSRQGPPQRRSRHRLHVGRRGNDTINAAFGKDRALGGARSRLHQHRDRRSGGLGELRRRARQRPHQQQRAQRSMRGCETRRTSSATTTSRS